MPQEGDKQWLEENKILNEGFISVRGALSGYMDYIKEPIKVDGKEEIHHRMVVQRVTDGHVVIQSHERNNRKEKTL